MEFHATNLRLPSVQIFSSALRSYTRQTDNQCIWSEVLVLDCSYFDRLRSHQRGEYGSRQFKDKQWPQRVNKLSQVYLFHISLLDVLSLYSQCVQRRETWNVTENGTNEIYEELQVKYELGIHSKNNTWKVSYYILVNTHELNSEVPGSILDKFSWFS